MNSEWLPHAILRTASFLAPRERRAEWLEEWRSELWYLPRRGTMRFCLGSFRDALWLRRNPSQADPVKRSEVRFESPLSCLAFLATLAAVSILIAVRIPALDDHPLTALRVRDLPGACTTMLLFSILLLPGTIAIWRAPADRQAMPWPSRLRRGAFLALKIALVQPMMLCGFLLQILMGPLGGVAGLGSNAAFIFALRWVITDQQQRCPVCLRLLTAPIRIGTPSQTFLAWYGAESICPHGHGVLQISGDSSSYSQEPQWISLGDSWSGLFSSAFPRRRS